MDSSEINGRRKLIVCLLILIGMSLATLYIDYETKGFNIDFNLIISALICLLSMLILFVKKIISLILKVTYFTLVIRILKGFFDFHSFISNNAVGNNQQIHRGVIYLAQHDIDSSNWYAAILVLFFFGTLYLIFSKDIYEYLYFIETKSINKND